MAQSKSGRKPEKHQNGGASTRKPGAALEKPNNNRDVNANVDYAVVQGGGLGGRVASTSNPQAPYQDG